MPVSYLLWARSVHGRGVGGWVAYSFPIGRQDQGAGFANLVCAAGEAGVGTAELTRPAYFFRTKAFLGMRHTGQVQSAGSSSKPKLGSLYT